MMARQILGGLGVMLMLLALALGLAGCQTPTGTTSTPTPPNHKFGEPVSTPTLYSFDDAAGYPLYFASEAEMKHAMQHRPAGPPPRMTPAPTPSLPTSGPSIAPFQGK